jgi:DNA-binding response OmpR family regulator
MISIQTSPANAALIDARCSVPSDLPLVLVVAEDDIIRTLLQDLLADEYRVVATPGGPASLQAVDPEPVAVVILDLNWPERVDPTLYQWLRAHRGPRGRLRAPLVALSGAEQPEASGHEGPRADAYVHKPFDVQELLDCVRAWTRSSAAARS